MKHNVICSKCVLDTTVPEIIFDSKGICNYCKIHDELEKIYPADEKGDFLLDKLIKKIKKSGKGKRYDCIVGVSGGTDSTYTLWLMKELGLNPLAVHFDNGWNSDIAVKNIKNSTTILDVDLYTHVADWEEFKDLQIAFLRSSTPDAEVPTDYAIISVLLEVAKKEKIKYIIEGQSFRAEGTTPTGWTYHDGKYLRSIQKKFGNHKSKSFPILSFFSLIYYFFILRIKFVRPLEYTKYSKAKARKVNIEKLGWIDPGGHHHESVYTKFFQSYYLPVKYSIDKRKRELSAQIRSGEIERDKALSILSAPYSYDPELITYTISKLGISGEEFEDIMKSPARSFLDYPNMYYLIRLLRFPILIACKLHIFPPIFYLKYSVDLKRIIKDYWNNFNDNK
jgi:N-acetyl sugar amidotransferase